MLWNKSWGATKVLGMTLLLSCLVACSQMKTQETGAQSEAIDPAELRRQALERDYTAALVLHREGSLEQAQRAYEQILQANPALVNPQFNLARIVYDQGDRNAAKDMLDKIIELKPGHKEAHNLLGAMAREEGRFEDAEAHYRKALATDPEFGPAIRNLGILLDIYQGRLAEALALYEQYQSLAETPDPKVKDWIFDLKRRIGDS